MPLAAVPVAGFTDDDSATVLGISPIWPTLMWLFGHGL